MASSVSRQDEKMDLGGGEEEDSTGNKLEKKKRLRGVGQGAVHRFDQWNQKKQETNQIGLTELSLSSVVNC
jgi:hypothetical protein